MLCIFLDTNSTAVKNCSIDLLPNDLLESFLDWKKSSRVFSTEPIKEILAE